MKKWKSWLKNRGGDVVKKWVGKWGKAGEKVGKITKE